MIVNEVQKRLLVPACARCSLSRYVAGRRAFTLPASAASGAAEVTALDRESFGGWLDRHGLTSSRRNEHAEIAIDFNCNSVAVVHEEGGQRLRSDAFFDASREALMEIVKSAMPNALGPASTR